jgi:hypothetical protein
MRDAGGSTNLNTGHHVIVAGDLQKQNPVLTARTTGRARNSSARR